MELLKSPRLPEKTVRLMVLSGEYPDLSQKLKQFKIQTVLTQPAPGLPAPVAFHADMQLCPIDSETLFVLKGSRLKEELHLYGITTTETGERAAPIYPADVRCNTLVLRGFLLGHFRGVDRALAAAATLRGLERLETRQGYAACSVCLVNNTSVITADRGIAVRLKQKGFDVLKIRPGHICLPGYDTGFIGGCCGLIDKNRMVFTGKLSTHPDGLRIREYLAKRNVLAIELSEQPLLDIGGMLPIA